MSWGDAVFDDIQQVTSNILSNFIVNLKYMVGKKSSQMQNDSSFHSIDWLSPEMETLSSTAFIIKQTDSTFDKLPQLFRIIESLMICLLYNSKIDAQFHLLAYSVYSKAVWLC